MFLVSSVFHSVLHPLGQEMEMTCCAICMNMSCLHTQHTSTGRGLAQQCEMGSLSSSRRGLGSCNLSGEHMDGLLRSCMNCPQLQHTSTG